MDLSEKNKKELADVLFNPQFGKLKNRSLRQEKILSFSKADLRKSNKPIMEKKRRARINHCLDELKGILLDHVKTESSQHSKLEKADILEMTVKHLQHIQRRQVILAVSLDHSILQKFQNGYSDCASELKNFLIQQEDIDIGFKERLSKYLDKTVVKLNCATPQNFGKILEKKPFESWPSSNISFSSSEPVKLTNLDDLNNNVGNQFSLVPRRLSTGELAFVMAKREPSLFHTSTPRRSAFSIVNPLKCADLAPQLSPISVSNSIEKPSLLDSSSGSKLFLDSGYKSDFSVSEIIQNPAVPQKSYLDMFPSSSSGTLKVSRDSFGEALSSSDSVKTEEKPEHMWRPW